MEWIVTFLKHTKSYLAAKFGPKASFKTYTERINACNECIWRKEKGSRNYCKECGCPETKFWPDSELKTKCAFLNAECPRKRWNTSKTDYMFTD